MRTGVRAPLILGLALIPFLSLHLSPQVLAETPEKTLTLHLRSRVETAKDSGRYHTLTREVRWDAARTAVVICDMWDKHWCPEATTCVAEMAPPMNEVVKEARRRGGSSSTVPAIR